VALLAILTEFVVVGIGMTAGTVVILYPAKSLVLFTIGQFGLMALQAHNILVFPQQREFRLVMTKEYSRLEIAVVMAVQAVF
jgi:hypothetical protein